MVRGLVILVFLSLLNTLGMPGAFASSNECLTNLSRLFSGYTMDPNEIEPKQFADAYSELLSLLPSETLAQLYTAHALFPQRPTHLPSIYESIYEGLEHLELSIKDHRNEPKIREALQSALNHLNEANQTAGQLNRGELRKVSDIDLLKIFDREDTRIKELYDQKRKEIAGVPDETGKLLLRTRHTTKFAFDDKIAVAMIPTVAVALGGVALTASPPMDVIAAALAIPAALVSGGVAKSILGPIFDRIEDEERSLSQLKTGDLIHVVIAADLTDDKPKGPEKGIRSADASDKDELSIMKKTFERSLEMADEKFAPKFSMIERELIDAYKRVEESRMFRYTPKTKKRLKQSLLKSKLSLERDLLNYHLILIRALRAEAAERIQKLDSNP